MILTNIFILIAGLTILIVFSDLFVDAASSLAIKLRVPKMMIALTIAAFGTCAPELAISFNSIASNNFDMTLANVIGSCIVNILLIIGIASIVKPIKVKDRVVKKELPLLITITAAFFFLISDSFFFYNIDNGLTRADAFMLLCWFVIFILYILRIVRKNKKDYEEKPKYGLKSSIFLIIASLFLILLGSELVVESATYIAHIFNVSQKVITMTVIVIGTSLPELIMTVTSAKKGEFDMAIGNIIGTNIFNMCVVLGLPIAIYGGVSSPAFGLVDTFVVFSSAIIFFLFGSSDKELTRREGIMMVVVFAVYYLYIFLT